MVRVFSALPARALRGRPPISVASILWGVFIASFLGLMLMPAAVLAWPGLAIDWQVRQGAVYLYDAAVRSSTCNTSDFLELCDLTLGAPVGAGQVERKVFYTFLSASDRPPYRVVADPAHPEWLSTDVGLDLFWSRVACSACAALMLGLLLWILGRGAMRGYRRQRTWRKGEAMAVPLRLVSRQNARTTQTWTVQGDEGPPQSWTVPRRAAPFVLGSAWEVLGLRLLDGSDVMPLDSNLRWVSLTKAERALVLGPTLGRAKR